MINFWQDLKQQLGRALIGLAPMDGITDQPFRRIVKKYGNPDVIYTEFVNVEGLCHNAEALLRPLLYDNSQRPILAQIYGKSPNSFWQAAVLICQLGFDGVDINMGCPSKNVAGGGAGAGLINNPHLAQVIIQAVKAGVSDWAAGKTCRDCADFSDSFCRQIEELRLEIGLTPAAELRKFLPIPVSVKTRIGYDQPAIKTWIACLAEAQPAAIAIHGRTLKQGYKGEANWELIAEAAEVIKNHSSQTLILGNGDVQNFSEAKEKAAQYNVDGVLIGRAAQGNPFVFDPKKPLANLSLKQKAGQLAKVALEHARLYEKTFCKDQKQDQQQDQKKNQEKDCFFLPMRKHLAWYVKSIPHAKEIRQKLVRTNSSSEVEEILTEFHLI